MTPAPIALFIYSRPDHLRRTLKTLAADRLAAESNLIVYADGPKNEEDREAVSAARSVAREARGFKSVMLIEREKNLGLAGSIEQGVTEVCAKHGSAIVVEDDLLVAPGFLGFLNAGLVRYRNEGRVLQVSGYSYPAHTDMTSESFFLPMVSCWGWATWQRAWTQYDPAMKELARLDRDPLARKRFNIDGTYDYYGMACQQREGRINSWGIRWQLSLFAADGVVLYPRRSLVSNAGFDGSGSHPTASGVFNGPLSDVSDTVAVASWPGRAETDRQAYDEVKRLFRNNHPSGAKRLLRWMRG